MKLTPIAVTNHTDVPVVCDACDARIGVERHPGGERSYRSVCGCRLWPVIPAQAFEQAFVAVLVDRCGPDAGFSLSSQVYGALVQVRVGPAPDRVSCVWRVTSRNRGHRLGPQGAGHWAVQRQDHPTT